MQNNVEHILDSISEILKNHPRVHKGILFGSRALGREKAWSDIDIAIDGDISYDDILWFYRAYDALYMPYRVDFVDYRNIANSALRDHIDRVGRVILEK